MRFPLPVKIAWWGFLALLWIAGWHPPSDWLAARLMLQSVDYWIYSHAAHPSLFALAVGLTIGTVIIPEAWKIIRAHWFPRTPEADMDADDAFSLVMSRSKWANRAAKAWGKLPPVVYEKSRPEAYIIERRIEQAFQTEIHRLLRNGTLSSWGKESPARNSKFTPEKEIPRGEWDWLEIEFEKSDQRNVWSRGIVLRNQHLELGSLAYVGLRFCRSEMKRVFPLRLFGKRHRYDFSQKT